MGEVPGDLSFLESQNKYVLSPAHVDMRLLIRAQLMLHHSRKDVCRGLAAALCQHKWDSCNEWAKESSQRHTVPNFKQRPCCGQLRNSSSSGSGRSNKRTALRGGEARPPIVQSRPAGRVAQSCVDSSCNRQPKVIFTCEPFGWGLLLRQALSLRGLIFCAADRRDFLHCKPDQATFPSAFTVKTDILSVAWKNLHHLVSATICFPGQPTPTLLYSQV
ncbi:hypothetical protein TREES_T100003313 [Tupaia chinensis]|uniref:Uncharacterized protein n=1 Tax=Tupaia chinensis TaxID=246437 RepID=L9JGP3_TUPCH|nr:hypothetical protein TREES_T100003313 [Tupaia chinensis]